MARATVGARAEEVDKARPEVEEAIDRTEGLSVRRVPLIELERTGGLRSGVLDSTSGAARSSDSG